MREILATAARWARDGEPFAVATLIGARGSSPREVGASMIVSCTGGVFGNVSGGCVEGAVYESCREAIASGAASVHTFGIADDDIFTVGLTCGDTVEILVWPVLPGSENAAAVQAVAEANAANANGANGGPTALAVQLSSPAQTRGADTEPTDPGPVTPGTRGSASLIASDTPSGATEVLHLDDNGCRVSALEAAYTFVVMPVGPGPRLVIVGAVEFSVALSRLGAAMGMAVTVVDPRETFASPERFPDAEVVHEWPGTYLQRTELDARTAVCVLSHDPRFDVPALQVALGSGAGYVGAMGSRRTHAERTGRLVAAGVDPTDLARLHSPIGLDLGGRTPEETALSILAEIVAVRHGAEAGPLSQRQGPVHRAGLMLP